MRRVTASSRWRSFRALPGPARWSAYVAVGLVLVLVVTLLGGVALLRRPLPQTDGVLSVPGLRADVEVLRDAQGVPQVYADDADDLFFAQGFVQAQDRFWQMDFRRHVTAGRLAELLGEDAVETDLVVRTLGWRRVAEQELELLDPATVSYLQAYSDGVNAWMADKDMTELGAEYSALALGGLGYAPEPWTPVDSLAWLKAMAWDLRGNMQSEIERSRLLVNNTDAQVEQLFPRYPYGENEPIVTTASGGRAGPAAGSATTTPTDRHDDRGVHRSAQSSLDAVEAALEAVPTLMGEGAGIGSNSWVVSGRFTESGQPLLANDPHLGTSLPGVWMQTGLHCREVTADCPFDVAGFTFAGVPGVVVGHNRDVAWGVTNLDPDVTDLYLEQVDGRTSLYDGRREPLEVRDEVIRVAGGESRTITVRATRHGPLLSDVSRELSSVGANADGGVDAPERGNGYAVALAWTALTPRPTMDALFGFNRASDWDEFREAARDFAVPSQNLVYADTSGNIGYQAPGDIPIRRAGRDGRVPVAGWDPANDWTGRTVPYDQLPSVLNPPEGFVVTANQAVAGPDYPFLLTTEPDLGYRSQRIRDLLERRVEDGPVGVDDLSAIQGDTRHPMAPVLVPYLMRQLLPSRYYAEGQRLLLDWDGSQPADSPAAAYFNAVWRNLLARTFHDDLPIELWPDGSDRWMGVVSDLLERPQDAYWDDIDTEGVIEDRDTVLAGALRDARDELTRAQSVNPKRWTWGHQHEVPMLHQPFGQSGNPLLGAIFDRSPLPVGGGSAAVDASSWYVPEGYAVTAAPSMRMVVDLGDLDASRWVDATGASGHPASDHYDDQAETWASGGSYAWPFTGDAVDDAASDRLLLRPASAPG